MTTNRVLSTTYAEIDIIKGLKFRANFSVDYSNVQESLYDDTWTNAGFSVNGSAQSISLNNVNWNQENYFTYSKNLNKHSFNRVAGISAQESKTNSTRATEHNSQATSSGQSPQLPYKPQVPRVQAGVLLQSSAGLLMISRINIWQP